MTGNHETIAAISTAMNNSGIGIIRISGDRAFDIIKKIFRPADPEKDLDQVKSHSVHYGTIVDQDQVLDEVLVLIMRGPHTYTREDTVEIDTHGGMFVIRQVLECVLRAGARAAEPGEFTKRAFLNGRIDLTQAEAVIDLINAENQYALKSAVTQLKGSVSAKIREQRALLLEQIAYIEAALDDPEHIEMEGYGKVLYPKLEEVCRCVEDLIRSADDGRIIKEGIRTVILGKPNVGKSSLLNALVGSDRAIVTQIPGTTRDALEESIRLKDVTLNIIDTAGIRNTEDVIEKIGVDKARDYAAEADLIVWMIDSSGPLDENDIEAARIAAGRKTIILLNKQDLPGVTDKDLLLRELPEDIARQMAQVPVIGISALKESGLEEFGNCVCHMFYNKDIDFNDQVYITNIRQKEALIEARESLSRAMESIQNQMPEDFFTIDLMDAYSLLGNVIGESVEDDLADEIFAKFCMGK
ncbi:MAG: tRNA uridine-5-carboxymethylaminomethyl(34) synthesis GTPase MnmE [Parasporobacterium sp.]|nr:tRNA uridine-5-carboxymethylaminomethyl(34) synthesis GTPase MnmE [Parasporobacterium sp.]